MTAAVASAPAAGLTWDVALRRSLVQGDRRFELALSFQSSARRLVLLGPSGSGKSQTLRHLAGLDRADAGHVRLDGHTLQDSASGLHLPPRQRRLGLLFQDYALFPHLTVAQNIAFGCQAGSSLNPRKGPPSAETAPWLHRLDLMAVAQLYPHQLSGGQRQRTALARALAAQPRALLLDEPFAALDAPLRERLRGELAELQARLDLPMILITHDEADARQLADEVLLMAHGRLQAALPATAPLDLPHARPPQAPPRRR